MTEAGRNMSVGDLQRIVTVVHKREGLYPVTGRKAGAPFSAIRQISTRANPMKTIPFLGMLSVSCVLPAQTLNQATTNPSAVPVPTPYVVVSREPIRAGQIEPEIVAIWETWKASLY